MNNHNVDLLVIGSGPGGYVASIRASQLGLNVICVERAEIGGICLNWGCIPTKALLKNAEYMNFLNHSKDFGFDIKDVKVDFPAIIKRSRNVANRMSNGVGYLFKKYKVNHIKGNAFIKSDNLVEVKNRDGEITDSIETKNIIIATGARPRMFEGIDVDNKFVITSKEALIQKKVPESMIIMGAGAIGVEFAYFYNAFGSKVIIIEMMDRILPIEDSDISKELARHYKKNKIKILTNTKVLSAKKKGKKVEVKILKKDGVEEILEADIALNAIGIQANIEDLGLENLGIELNKGFIKVNGNLKTNIDNIFAIGDVAGPPWLAHKASAEAIACAEYIAGYSKEGINYKTIPACTYCNPQVASIGLTEAKAKAEGYDVRIGKFPFTANGKAHGIGEAKGFVKIVFDNKYGEILGASLIGPDVTELIAEIAIAMSSESTAKTLFKTIHAHPTLSEAIMEASAQAYNEAVNI